MKKEVVAMLLAGGQGSPSLRPDQPCGQPRRPLRREVPHHRFPLSNCVHSGIDTVGVLTQYRPSGAEQLYRLRTALGPGQVRRRRPYPAPYMREGDQGTWYKGTANAIYQNIGFLDLYDPEYVVILSGDHIYKMDYTGYAGPA